MLTTVTVYWKRPETLKSWVSAVRAASFKEVRHLVYFIGEQVPDWWARETNRTSICGVVMPESPVLSIGHYHNLAAARIVTPWMMKMDVDALPHVGYFRELVPLLKQAQPRQWFNGGMFYLRRTFPPQILGAGIPVDLYARIMQSRPINAGTSCIFPAGSNFICRAADYMTVGGCDERFRGYGWEDYYQLYLLQSHRQGGDALPGPVNMQNVTQRCRDELSRFQARNLWERNNWLCLLHYWHPPNKDPGYRAHMDENKRILLERILCTKANGLKPCPTPSSL